MTVLTEELDRLTRGASARTAPQAPGPLPWIQRAITALIIFGPFVGAVFAIVRLFGRGVTLLDLGLAVVFYAIAGHGVTIGYHRMLTHRSFKATRATKIALAIAGSFAFEGTVNGWVANHRRHHAYTDVLGDPHSPYAYGTTLLARIRGAGHAHVGWLFQAQPTDVERWAPDLAADRDLVLISQLFPLWCVLSLGLPTLIGWLVTGTAAGAISAFLWAGLVRVFLLHHSTFAVNSACHIWGTRPFKTRATDRATNFAPLAILSMGESWHNLHHSNPRFARYGVDRAQIDTSARLIRWMERAGLVSEVRWPTPAQLDARRRTTAVSVLADDDEDAAVDEPTPGPQLSR